MIDWRCNGNTEKIDTHILHDYLQISLFMPSIHTIAHVYNRRTPLPSHLPGGRMEKKSHKNSTISEETPLIPTKILQTHLMITHYSSFFTSSTTLPPIYTIPYHTTSTQSHPQTHLLFKSSCI
ncbi:hypothetical protein OCU04_003672 [Sclerotinia nivalis]|uniref:Uncharacterized protein n=1 Tax=Sclerotinia nivalis TaxID=352851 RepID=A0A9X0DMY5_9HELO|nr:hypothetical protein OCU04_003672 [Sclerotinia nivalis]